MKVTKSDKAPVGVKYSDIKTGECFTRIGTNSIMIKTDTYCERGFQAVSLSSGMTYAYRADSEGFVCVDAEVVVHG